MEPLTAALSQHWTGLGLPGVGEKAHLRISFTFEVDVPASVGCHGETTTPKALRNEVLRLWVCIGGNVALDFSEECGR